MSITFSRCPDNDVQVTFLKGLEQAQKWYDGVQWLKRSAFDGFFEFVIHR